MNRPHYLLYDISNIARMAWHVHEKEPIEVICGMSIDTVLKMLNKYYKMFDPDELILACDRPNWRVDYTKSHKCVSSKVYKADRDEKLTDKEKERKKIFKNNLREFEDLIDTHTSIITLFADGCEADDFIGRFCQNYSDIVDITIISSDKDYVQLLKHRGVKLMNPLDGKYRTLEEWDNNHDWHLFVKCIRAGEDNIQSAYPRVRLTKLREAYEDPYKMVNIMQHEWVHSNGKTYKVEELFKENQHLMDLEKQPDYIKTILDNTIEDALTKKRKYDSFKFIRWCGNKQLKAIIDNIDYLKPMLSNKSVYQLSGKSSNLGGRVEGLDTLDVLFDENTVDDDGLLPLVE